MRTLLLSLSLLTTCAVASTPSAPTSVATARYESRLLDLVNQARAKFGLREIESNPRLNAAAAWMAQDLSKSRQLSHTDSLGRRAGQRATEQGYDWSMVGENLALGYQTPESVLNAWLNSPGHRKNILTPDFQEVGFGLAPGRRPGQYVWVQVFGRSATSR